MSGDRSQKTEAATPKRKKELRKKGQVARSQALVSWISLLLATFMVPAVGSHIALQLSEGIRGVERISENPDTHTLLAEISGVGWRVFIALTPLLVGAMIIGIVGNLAQVGFVFTFGPLTPKFEKVNPVQGLKRLFSVRSLWETGKQLITVGLIAAVAVPAILGTSRTLLGGSWSLGPALEEMYRSLVRVIQMVAAVGCLIGAADFAWQRFNLKRDSKMTKQEIKQEVRESEGDPHLKARLRSNQIAISRNRMLAAVAHADVVITNPTHVAIALSYDPLKGAPRVVARGADNMAARIRERAGDGSVAVIEAPPLARALYRSCRVDDEIPVELFQAVATVLAFVRRIQHRSSSGVPTPLQVPDTWTPTGEQPDMSLVVPRTRRRSGRRRRRPVVRGA